MPLPLDSKYEKEAHPEQRKKEGAFHPDLNGGVASVDSAQVPPSTKPQPSFFSLQQPKDKDKDKEE
jgi:hypothetical protein